MELSGQTVDQKEVLITDMMDCIDGAVTNGHYLRTQEDFVNQDGSTQMTVALMYSNSHLYTPHTMNAPVYLRFRYNAKDGKVKNNLIILDGLDSNRKSDIKEFMEALKEKVGLDYNHFNVLN